MEDPGSARSAWRSTRWCGGTPSAWDAAVQQIRPDGFPATDEMCARRSPIADEHITFLGRCALTCADPKAGLRPLHDPAAEAQPTGRRLTADGLEQQPNGQWRKRAMEARDIATGRSLIPPLRS